MNKFPLRLILDNIRSAANVGSILRTADACGVELVYVAGYTPYPELTGDKRPPHVISANTRSIAKTALGAQVTMPIHHTPDAITALAEAEAAGFSIIVLEQSENSLMLNSYQPTGPTALVLGNEVEGVSQNIRAAVTHILEIPMLGHKESYGVAVAAGIALHHLRFASASVDG
jgi:23S rRNA (guanosine2251-2'-O)-methyltransferase